MYDLNLDEIQFTLHTPAHEAFEEGDAAGFVGYADNLNGLALDFDNVRQLKARGIYESALLVGLTGNLMGKRK